MFMKCFYRQDTVNSVRKSFEDGRWSKQSIAEHQAVLRKLADLIEDHREELGLYECLGVGESISMVRFICVN